MSCSVPVYVPESVDLSFLKPRSRPAAQWFLHSLYTQQVNKRRSRNRPVPLYSKILRKFMGKSYAKVIAALVHHGVVERGKYRKGKYSRLYKLTDQYADDTHQRTELTGKILCRKIRDHREGERSMWFNVHHYLFNWLNLVKLDISDKMHSKYHKQRLPIDTIRNQDFMLNVDKYQRVHTNVTNLKRSLRKYLTIGNVKLVEIDICNSQPLMLAILLRDFYSNNSKFLVATSPSLFSVFSERETPTTPLSPLCGPFLGTDEIPEDVKRYVELCEEGRVYQYLRENIDHPSTKTTGFKKRVLSRIFYCKNKDQDNDLFQQFTKLFPNVGDFIRYLKRSDYRHLPQQLQRVEAGLVIHGVCGRLMNEFPNVPVLTVHDSILTTPAHEPLVRKLLTEEALALGVRISTKTK